MIRPKRYLMKLAERELQLGDRTLIMGIINVTPDSFSDGGQNMDPERAAARALELEEAGADIIDIGAESTRPGSERISEAEELRRLIPVLKKLKGKLSVPISVDTTRSAVAAKALESLSISLEGVRAQVKQRIEKTAKTIAELNGATATFETGDGVPVTYNDPELTRWGTQSLGRGVGGERVKEIQPVMGAEDFSILARAVPGMFFFLGITPPDEDAHTAPANHSPLFHIHEPALKYGVRALTYLAFDYLRRK